MNTKRSMAFLPLLIAVLLAAGCYYMPSGAQGSARVSMALTKGLPGNVSSIALIVSGPGMKTMANEYPAGTTSVSVEVPAGLARTFTLLANTPSVTLRGDATTDLVAGETQKILLTPATFDTQIIVPDYLNYRLVQISDMTGTGWTAINYGNLGLGMSFATQFAPYDVDFDDQGRIYVANADDGVIRLDDIFDIAAEWDLKGSVAANPVKAIAIDRPNQILYFANGSSLAKIDVAAFGTVPTPTALTGTTSTNITGLAVGPDGSLYLTNYGGGSGGFLIRYDPVSQTVLVSYPSTTSLDWDPWDVSVQGGYVYTTHMLSSGVYKISRSDLNLKPMGEFSAIAAVPLYGPRRFVAILSKRITFIDDAPFPANADRLVSMNNIDGTGLQTYGSSGSGQDQFNFYSMC